MLSDAKIRAAKPRERPWRMGDSGQLYLFVTPAGGKLWRMNYSFGRNAAGKPMQKTLSFGAYPAVSLSQARARRDEAKRFLAQKQDPAVALREAENANAVTTQPSFQSVAEMWFEHNSGWSIKRLWTFRAANDGKWNKRDAAAWIVERKSLWSTVHSADVLRSLERDIFPALGNRPITDIRALDVREVLQEVQARGSIETAHRLRQRVSAVFIWGNSCGLCEGDPASSIGMTLKPVPPARHQPAIIDEHSAEGPRMEAIRTMLAACEALPGRAQNKLAMRLMALTAVRPGELAGARWSEFFDLDGDSPVWIIPAGRMKGPKARKDDLGSDHQVPLARQSVEVLRVLHRLTGHYDLCFPGERHAHRPISENTLRAMLIRAGYFQRHVPHGFRACFSTVMNERAEVRDRPGDRLVLDLMLAHTPSNGIGSRNGGRAHGNVSAVEAAYNRAAYMPRRTALAQEWADLLLEGLCAPDLLVEGPIRRVFASNGQVR